MFAKEILTSEKVRTNLSDIRQWVMRSRQVVHWGNRGQDEAVIMSSEQYKELLARARASESSGPNPWEGLSAAFTDGRLYIGKGVGERTRSPDQPVESGLSWEAMAALGADERSFRRRPR